MRQLRRTVVIRTGCVRREHVWGPVSVTGVVHPMRRTASGSGGLNTWGRDTSTGAAVYVGVGRPSTTPQWGLTLLSSLQLTARLVVSG